MIPAMTESGKRPRGRKREAAEAAMTTFGGYGVAKEYDIERKWKETRLFRTAPISNNLVLAYVAQHVLQMPRSY